MMALAGVPYLFSGFWSKEAILRAALGWNVSTLPLYAGLAGVVLTAFYMTRLLCEVFCGGPRSPAASHARESPAVITIPLVILAIGSIGLGFLGTPAWPWLQSELTGEAVPAQSIFEGGGLTVLSILLVAVGIGSGWALYGRRPRATESAADPVEAAVPGLFAFLAARMKIDEAYAATLGRLNSFGAALADFLDRRVWGGLVSLLGRLGEGAGIMNTGADEAGINAAFDAVSEGFRRTGQAYSRAQTGAAQGYLRALAVAFVVLALLVLMGGSR
jgi:NADH-quinone oxidoreductase subunit L